MEPRSKQRTATPRVPQTAAHLEALKSLTALRAVARSARARRLTQTILASNVDVYTDPTERKIEDLLREAEALARELEALLPKDGRALAKERMSRGATRARAVEQAFTLCLRDIPLPPTRRAPNRSAPPELTVMQLAKQIATQRKIPLSSAMVAADELARKIAKASGKPNGAWKPMGRGE